MVMLAVAERGASASAGNSPPPELRAIECSFVIHHILPIVTNSLFSIIGHFIP